MASSPEAESAQYYLIPRDRDGEYLTVAESVLEDQGIHEYVETVTRSSAFSHGVTAGLLEELQDQLPENVHLAADNPFLTLRVEATQGGAESGLARCECKCGKMDTCGGGGGGAQ